MGVQHALLGRQHPALWRRMAHPGQSAISTPYNRCVAEHDPRVPRSTGRHHLPRERGPSRAALLIRRRHRHSRTTSTSLPATTLTFRASATICARPLAYLLRARLAGRHASAGVRYRLTSSSSTRRSAARCAPSHQVSLARYSVAARAVLWWAFSRPFQVDPC